MPRRRLKKCRLARVGQRRFLCHRRALPAAQLSLPAERRLWHELAPENYSCKWPRQRDQVTGSLLQAVQRILPAVPASVPLFTEARKGNDEFNDIVRAFEQNPAAEGLNIESILVKPIQRVCKYELFLRDMGKKAAKTDDANLQMDVVMALQVTKEAVSHVNQKDKDAENLAKVAALHGELRPANTVNLLKAHMRLILEANVMAIEVPSQAAAADSMSDPFGLSTKDHLKPPRLPKSPDSASNSDAALQAPLSTVSAEPVHAFLLTDILILSRFKLKKKGLMRRQDKHRYHIAQIIPLHNARVSVIDSGSCELGLGTHALKLEWAEAPRGCSVVRIKFAECNGDGDMAKRAEPIHYHCQTNRCVHHTLR